MNGFVSTIDIRGHEADFKARLWVWYIQTGGGWAGVRGGELKRHVEGKAFTALEAERAVEKWVEEHGER